MLTFIMQNFWVLILVITCLLINYRFRIAGITLLTILAIAGRIHGAIIIIVMAIAIVIDCLYTYGKWQKSMKKHNNNRNL